MRRFNPELLERIFAVCEESGATTVLTPDHYEMFLNMDYDTVYKLSKQFIRNTAEDINRKLKEKKIRTGEDLVRHVRDWWEMMIQGFVVLDKETGRFMFRKPRGASLSPAMEARLDQKLDNMAPAIMRAFDEVVDEGQAGES